MQVFQVLAIFNILCKWLMITVQFSVWKNLFFKRKREQLDTTDIPFIFIKIAEFTKPSHL